MAISGRAQQSTQYSLYMLNPSIINPAYAGLEESLNFTGVFRQQWVGLNGSPTQQVLTGQMPLYFLNSGIGLSFENDVLGSRRYSNFSLQYSYQFQTGNGTLSFGINADAVQLNWDGAQLRTPEGEYLGGTLNHNDVLLPTNNVNGLAPSFGAGFYYKTEKLSLGVSVKNINEPVLNVQTVSLALNRHYYFIGNYQLDVTRKIALIPNILVKSDGLNLQSNLNLQISFDGNVFVGSGVRGYNNNSLDGVMVFGGWKFSEQAILAYNYDFSVSELATVNDGSHEVVLKYALKNKIGKGKLPKVIYNPRFL